MNEFNEKFGGILLAYLNDTSYTLDNSECNELSKFVEGLTAEVERLTAELAATKEDYLNACSLVAAMHAAAVGEVRGPIVGVVEDVANVRAELAAMRERERWVSVSERMPPVPEKGDVDYLVWGHLDGQEYSEQWVCAFRDEGTFDTGWIVTHWRELPATPEAQ